MKSHRKSTVCIVYDTRLVEWVGRKNAQAFDWLYSFLHLSDKEHGDIYDGRRWGAFTYSQLADLSHALPNEYAWRRALDELVDKGLVYREYAPGLGNYFAINFHKLKTKLGDGFDGYALDMQAQSGKLPNWVSPDPPKPRKKSNNPEQNAQGRAEQNGQGSNGKSEQNAQGTLSKMHRPPEQNAQGLLYRIDSSDSSVDSSTAPNGAGDTARKRNPIEFDAFTVIPKRRAPFKSSPMSDKQLRDFIFGTWMDLTYPGHENISKGKRSMIGRSVNNVINAFGLMTAHWTIQRFEAWLVITDRGFVQGTIKQPSWLESSFTTLVNHEKQNGFEWYEAFEAEFTPAWRKSYAGKYSTLAELAQKQFPELVSIRFKGKRQRTSWQQRRAEETVEVTAEQKSNIEKLRQEHASQKPGRYEHFKSDEREKSGKFDRRVAK